MLTSEQEQKIIKLAFKEELEKNANWISSGIKLFSKIAPKAGETLGKSKTVRDMATNAIKSQAKRGTTFGFNNLGKYFTGAKDAFKSGKGHAYLKSFADKQVIKNKLGGIGAVNTQSAGRFGANAGIVQRMVGNTARELEFLGKGISKKNPLSQNIATLGKNVVNDTKRQITNARFKIVDPDGIAGNIKKFKSTSYKTKGMKIPGFNKRVGAGKTRDIVGWTAKGDPITKKRKLAQIGAVAMTPAGFAATSAATGDPKEGVKDYFAWKTPIGQGKLMYDLINPGKKKEI